MGPGMNLRSYGGGTTPTPSSTVQDKDVEAAYQKLIRELDNLLQTAPSNSKIAPVLVDIRDAIKEASQSPRDQVCFYINGFMEYPIIQMATMSLVQKLVETFLNSYSSRSTEPEWMSHLRDVFIACCRILTNIFGGTWLQNKVTRVLIECRQDYR